MFTGDLKAFVDTPGGDLTFLSGSGNDEIDIARDANTAGHVLDGGAGNDELTITGDASSAVDAGHTAIGGEGNDTILLTGDASGPIAGHVVNSFDLVSEVGGDGDDTITITGDAIGTKTVVMWSSVVQVLTPSPLMVMPLVALLVMRSPAVPVRMPFASLVMPMAAPTVVMMSLLVKTTILSRSPVILLPMTAGGSGHSVEGNAGNDLIKISGDALAVPRLIEIVPNPFFDPPRAI